jgi:hypothetical protein
VLVRRPDVRPTRFWLDERSTAVAAVVRDDVGAIGLLFTTRAAAALDHVLEEVVRLRDSPTAWARTASSPLAPASDVEVGASSIACAGTRAETASPATSAPGDRVRDGAAGPAASYSLPRARRSSIERLAQAVEPITLLTVPESTPRRGPPRPPRLARAAASSPTPTARRPPSTIAALARPCGHAAARAAGGTPARSTRRCPAVQSYIGAA